MTTPGAVPVIDCAGTPFEIGYQHGSRLAGRLRCFLDDAVARLGHLLPEPVTLTGLRPEITAYRSAITAALPDAAEEVRGLAAGAGITAEQAWLLQIRRELLGYRKVPAQGDCTTYATSGPRVLLAQTIDLNGNLDDQLAVLRIAHRDSGRRVLVLSFAGLLGYLGVNSDGLAIGLNLVLGGDWSPGIPPYLAIRHLLDTCADTGQALERLEALPLTGSRSLTLTDGRNTRCIEFLDNDIREIDRSVHANHFLHPQFSAHDELNVFARNSSRLRLDAATTALAALPDSATIADHFALLCRAPICVPDHGDIRRERTVAAVVLDPGSRELHLRPGDPNHAQTLTFACEEALEPR
ncbi:C45 family autoproteolytic acyltransferase/hydolase [Nocardia inohanensis]|uniref:C45 family autoproteolytic acyltransferase/hydolase n=1 Tax=Nocardia inohanensis TaxID=209246 RepID=UPI000833C988|nr:C45 family peptidase [Nocardia inohanensis]